MLATLATSQVQTSWPGRGRRYPHHTLADHVLASGDDAPVIRYGEVMAALEPAPNNGHWGAFGTRLSPRGSRPS